MQMVDVKNLDKEGQNLRLNVGHCMEVSDSSRVVNIMASVDARVASYLAQSLATVESRTGLGRTKSSTLHFTHKSKKGHCLQLCDVLCQGQKLHYF